MNRLNQEIQALLIRKAKADAQSPEIRKQYANYYNQIIAKVVEYGLNNPLPTWDYDINSEILSITLKDMAKKWEHKKPYVEWMCQSLLPDIDASFKERDQKRFSNCIQLARQQLKNV